MVMLDLPFGNVVRLTTSNGQWGYAVDRDLPAVLAPNAEARLVNSCVMVEWLSPRGGHFLYGLLGAHGRRTEGDCVELHVKIGHGTHAVSATLADGLDEVHVGLPITYGRAVLAAATASMDGYLPASRICFDAALHGELGSSEVVFGRLGEAVALLLGMRLDEEPRLLRDAVAGALLKESK